MKTCLFQILYTYIRKMENTPEAEKVEAGHEDKQLENPEVNKAEADQKDLSQPVKPKELTLEQQPSEVVNHVHEGGSIAR